MARYLVEAYAAGGRTDEMRATAARFRRAADAASGPGRPVRYLRSTLLPEDETCFHLFEAPSAAAVGAALDDIGFSAIRIVEAVE